MAIASRLAPADYDDGHYSACFDGHHQARSVTPGRSTHDALDRVQVGLRKQLHQVIDLDLRSFFDMVRHDLLLAKIARRVRDDDLLGLCKRILKASGQRGIPQGSVIGPLWANVFLDDVDRLLERLQVEAEQAPYEVVRYTRYADDRAPRRRGKEAKMAN
jgi:RNA-directed DNA polymerase